MKSTKDYPDEVINFMRSHSLIMYQAIYPLQRRPWWSALRHSLIVSPLWPWTRWTQPAGYEVLFLWLQNTHCCSRPLHAGPAPGGGC